MQDFQPGFEADKALMFNVNVYGENRTRKPSPLCRN
jgi:hypothetical protein